MGIFREIIHQPFPDAMRKAEHAPGGFFQIFLGSNAYLRDDIMNAANDAQPHLSSPAVEALYEILSGFGQEPLKGSTWLPFEAAESLTSYCVENHLLCTFISSVDPHLAAKLEACKKAGVATCVSVDGPFSAVAATCGWEVAIAATHKGEKALFEDEAEKCLAAVFAAGEAGADCIVVADEVASPEGPLAAPEFLPQLAEYWRQMVENASAMGVPAVFHSDGDLCGFCPQLAEAGFSGVHIANGVDIGRASALFEAATKAELTPIGGIPALALGQDASVIRAHVEALTHAYPASIIADDGGMTTPEELAAFARVY